MEYGVERKNLGLTPGITHEIAYYERKVKERVVGLENILASSHFDLLLKKGIVKPSISNHSTVFILVNISETVEICKQIINKF